MSVSLRFDGLEDLREALRRLPEELAAEGANVVETHGNRAHATISSGYPRRVGDLAKGLKVTHTRSRFGARSTVINRAKQAAVFERGSQVRHYYTRNGVKHLTGKMPPNPLFSRTMSTERRAMDADHADLLKRHGLAVSGAA